MSTTSTISTSALPVASLGTPRIGPRRELKFALESFWSGATSESALIEAGAGLRAANWARQKKLGVTVIPSNDFSFYDQVLDTSVMVGVHPLPLHLPLLPVRATCGFPSPAEDFYGSQDVLDINQRVVRNPVATFYVEADTGTSMVEFGIFPGDTLVVDRSLTARHGDIVMVCWEGGFTVKQLRLRAGRYELHSGNPAHAPILVPEDVELDVWGVVTWSFRKQLRR